MGARGGDVRTLGKFNLETGAFFYPLATTATACQRIIFNFSELAIILGDSTQDAVCDRGAAPYPGGMPCPGARRYGPSDYAAPDFICCCRCCVDSKMVREKERALRGARPLRCSTNYCRTRPPPGHAHLPILESDALLVHRAAAAWRCRRSRSRTAASWSTSWPRTRRPPWRAAPARSSSPSASRATLSCSATVRARRVFSAVARAKERESVLRLSI